MRPPRSARSLSSERSAPAQNPRPAPVSTITRTCVVLLGRVHRRADLLLHYARPGIQLVGTIQRDGGDAAGDSVEDFLKGHGSGDYNSAIAC